MQNLGALPAVAARLLYGIPYLTTYGFMAAENLRIQNGWLYAQIGRAVTFLGLRFASGVIVTTEALKEFVLRRVPAERVHFLPNGVDLVRFPLADRPPLSPDRVTVVLFVGRLIGQKNLPLLVRAAARVRHPLRLRLAGEGPEAKTVEDLAREKGVRVEMLGAVPYERMPGLYAEADLFALPSIGEGQPKVLLEAFASGLPCVGTDVRGIRDVIRHNETGLLCPPSEEALAACLERLIEQPDLARSLALVARCHVKENHDLSRLLVLEVDLLRRLARP
jgi:glycosyltransferase involved in cell wall biosynthesis